MQVLQNCASNSSSASVSVDHVRSASRVDVDNASTRNIKPTKNCGNCGRQHPPRACPAFGKTCRACNKVNHFEEVCRSTNRTTLRPRSASTSRRNYRRRRSSSTSINEISSDATDHPSDTYVDEIMLSLDCISEDGTASTWYQMLLINGSNINCKLDTGAQANVMSLDVAKSLKQPARWTKTSVRLKPYGTAHSLIPVGVASLNVQHKSGSHKLEFYVIDIAAPTIIGIRSCVELDLLRRVESVSSDDVMKQYSDLFSGLGKMPGKHHIVTDPTVRPVVQPPRRVSLSVQPKLKQTLDDLIRRGVLVKRDEPTEWVNSLMIVHKKDGTLRLCLDPKDLNAAICREHYVIPTIDDVTPQLAGKKVFSTIDMKDGFWNIELDEESSKLCTFNTPFGRYSFTRLPFGIKSAPEVFQKRMSDVFGNIPGVFVVFDDIITAACDNSEHDEILRQLFERARLNNVRFNRNKLQLRVSEVRYLGHLLTSEGIKPDPDKLSAIADMSPPTDKKGIHRLLGMLKYLSKFVPNFSDQSKPLRDLLRNDVSFVWQPEHQCTFDKLKSAIISAPILSYFDPHKPITIQTDASSTGLGSCLMQEGKPVAFGSRALSEAESRYAQIEKELLAIVFACLKFQQYIYGQDVIVQSDHKPLEAIFRKQLCTTTPRLQRMLLKLLPFNLNVVYTPGKKMFIADTLSRAYLPSMPSSTEQ